MSGLIDPNQYLKLKNYSEKYNVSIRKLYRYRDNDMIDFLEMDGIPFIKDQPFNTLMVDNRYSNDKIVTTQDYNDKIVTIQDYNNTDNQKVSNDKNLTLGIDKIVTLSNYEKKLLNKPDSECTISDFDEKEKIKEKIRKYSIKI